MMFRLRMKLGLLILAVSWMACSVSTSNKSVIKDGDYSLEINLANFQFCFKDNKGKVIVPNDTVSGLYIEGSPVVATKVKSEDENWRTLEVTAASGQVADVSVQFEKGVAIFNVSTPDQKEVDFSLRTGGMPVAHGLGDAGAWGKSFNLVEQKDKTFPIVNNGGSKRWLSTFTIFPQNDFAGVFFNKGKKNVVLGPDTYQMNIKDQKNIDFIFFIGDTKTIYKKYQMVRNERGYKDVAPKSRLFELGWESWDALGWNTNQFTVKDILSKFHKEGYPIRWAVTGSGFWDEGGTTTSFGRFGKKFPKPEEFTKWMHDNDMSWMIGLRINFIPSGGPYYPKTKKRDKNLKVRSFYGNNLSDEGLKNDFFLKDKAGMPVKMTSGVFPIVPCYLLDGNVPGAAQWYQKHYAKWKIDGIKEDTMMDLKEETSIFNKPMCEIADKGGLVMARCGNFSAPGTLLRINDTGVGNLSQRIPINYFQYAACGAPNVYSDVAGVHNMHNVKDVDRNIRHTWLLSLTSGLAVGAFPSKWPENKREIFKKAIEFHYTLVPYMYSAAVKSHKTGYPYTLTPLSIAYPNDEKAAKHPNFEWMIGESVLAAPLLKNAKTGKMDVYLPEGTWYDWETGRKFEGPLTLNNHEIALDKIPCFVGGNGIVLLRDKKSDQLTVRAYKMGKKASETFVSMDGKTNYSVTVKAKDLNDASVTDLTLNKKVQLRSTEQYIEFDLVEGHNYEIN
ncbi:hypothetical protein EYV94_13315 [Puteibacter caeruleilacunae]|nr:hypothetical protein EYV94_13315 [Puteibacter caeruleilacunae]